MENLTTKELTQLNKIKSHAFGKDIYFIGEKDGINYWLEEAKWDCGWYWGFGYIETYTNNKRPDLARDISSHSHWDSSIIGKHEYYDSDKKCFRQSTEYIHNSNDFFGKENSPLTENESWSLAELMQSFYRLKETAEILAKGSAHVTSNPCSETIKNEAEAKRINEIVLPAVFAEVYKLLTP